VTPAALLGEAGTVQLLRRPKGDLIAWAVLAAALLAPLPGLITFTGPPMEEGFMLVFPQLVAAGKVPHVDFLHLYGPGSLWVLAAIYKVFGATLEVQRMVGWVQHGALVFGLFALIRPWSRVLATGLALTALVQVITPVGLTALAWDGAIALAVWSLVLATASLDTQAAGPLRPDGSLRSGSTTDPGRPTWWMRWRPAVAGLLAGLALLYRPDLIVAIGLAVALMWWLLAGRDRRLLAAGTAIGVAPMLVHLAISGPFRAINGMVLDPVLRLRGGRTLPSPPSTDELASTLQRAAALRTNGWPFPQPSAPMQVVVWFYALLLGSLAIIVVAALVWRQPQPSTHRPVSCPGGARSGRAPPGVAAARHHPPGLGGLPHPAGGRRGARRADPHPGVAVRPLGGAWPPPRRQLDQPLRAGADRPDRRRWAGGISAAVHLEGLCRPGRPGGGHQPTPSIKVSPAVTATTTTATPSVRPTFKRRSICSTSAPSPAKPSWSAPGIFASPRTRTRSSTGCSPSSSPGRSSSRWTPGWPTVAGNGLADRHSRGRLGAADPVLGRMGRAQRLGQPRRSRCPTRCWRSTSVWSANGQPSILSERCR
jgi:hypothetical protein